jgi:holo-[acyl-carrier-protein] synthase
MIFVGVDTVKNSRFVDWNRYSDIQLRRILHSVEVVSYRELLIKNEKKAVLYLASRFAVKEAFFKAYSSMIDHHSRPKLSFLTISQRIFVGHNDSGAPVLNLEQMSLDNLKNCSISIAHETCCSVAVVTLESII